MKRTEKAWLRAAAVLAAVGILMVAGVMTANGWDLEKAGGAGYTEEMMELDAGFESLTISADTADITLALSGDGTCRAVFRGRKGDECRCERDGNALRVEVRDVRKWYERLVPSFGSSALMLYLPAGGYGTLAVESDTGDVAIPAGMDFSGISVSADTGDTVCRASASGEVRIESHTGDIELEGVSAGGIALTVSTGRVRVSDCACAGGFSVTVSTGRTELKDLSCGDLSSRGSTGRIEMADVVAEGTLSVERSTGDVRFERCDAAEIDVKTSTGDVTGSLLSEKIFFAKSSTGRVKVPESLTGGPCRVTTGTGDIALTIG